MNQTFILLTLSLPLVHNLAANHRQHAMGLQNLHLRNLHDVGREHGEVSELANFDRAAQLLFKRHVGGPDSEHLERLLARYGLFRMPAFARKPAHIPARDGSVKFDHWFAAFDRRVRAAGNNHAAFKKTLPRVGPVKPLDAETAGREMQIANRVRRLHRGNYSQFGEAGDVRRADYLLSLIAPARLADLPLFRRHRFKRLLVLVEDETIGAIADRMSFDLNAFT